MFHDECCAGSPAVTLLHVAESCVSAEAVSETLAAEGWSVEQCGDGISALERISGETHYDLFIFDHNLPGLHGIELVRRTRAMAHRQRTPIIMLSTVEVKGEARRAGANAFLRKPDDVHALAETVTRLLARRQRQNRRGEQR